MPLQPAVQSFTVNAAEYLAGIDEMIAATDKLAASIDQTVIASERMGVRTGAGAAAAAGGGAAAATAGAAGESAAAADANAAAQTRQAEAEKASGDAADFEAQTLRLLAETDKMLADSAAVVTEAMGAEARAIKLTGDAAMTMEEKTAGAADKGAALGSGLKTAFLGGAVAIGYGVEQASKFQSEVTKLYTAAGLTGKNVGYVSQQILKVGDATGFTGTQIAEALYHPVSAGLDLKTALAAVDQGARLAQIHGASLDDTMYALSSVMKAFNQNAGDAGKTAALLNSIVGQGDMRFQDFNQSVKNWAPTAASMGISIQSMGAGIAYLTDRGNSAEVASTRLTMGLSMVTAGSKQANTFLKDLGLTTGSVALKNQTLAKTMNAAGLTTNKIASDLKKPDGLYVALSDIQTAFHKSGLSAAQADQVMAKIFGGGRSDKAILSLMSNLDGVKQKYESIGKGVSDYGNSWAKTQQTVSFQWKKAVGDVHNLAISFGSVLLPAALKVLTVLGKFMSFLQAHPAIAAFAGAILAVAVAFKVVAAAEAIFNAVTDANPIMLVLIAVIALAAGMYELYKHSALVRQIVHDVAQFFKTAFHDAMHLAGDAVTWFVHGPLAFIKQQLAVFAQFWKAHGAEIEQIARKIWTIISFLIVSNFKVIMDFIKAGLAILRDIWNIAWAIIKDTVVMVWHLIADVVRTAIHLILDIIGVVLDLITGKWGKAWDSLKKLASDALHGAASVIRDVSSGFGNLLYDAGQAIILGFVNGIRSMFGAVASAASTMVSSLGHTVLKVLGIGSPSKVAHWWGQMVAEGLANGITSGKQKVTGAAGQLAAGVTSGLGSPYGGLVAGAGTGGGATITNHITVQGYIGNEQQLAQQLYLLIQRGTLQANHRNPTNGLNLLVR